MMNIVSQWWIGGLRTRKAKVAGSIPEGGFHVTVPAKSLLSEISLSAIEKTKFLSAQRITFSSKPLENNQILL
jgi:hypothetical protein